MYAMEDILRLADRYAAARRIATSTLARIATGSSTWLDRCATGRVTVRSANAVVQWLSDHWPNELEWPTDIARPRSVSDSVAAALMGRPTSPHDLLGAVKEAKRRMFASVQRGDWQAARRAESDMLAAGMRIGPSGQIASPAALCRALGVRRHVYDDVIRRYRDETGAGRWPREGNHYRVLAALISAEDARFASRRAVRARAAA